MSRCQHVDEKYEYDTDMYWPTTKYIKCSKDAKYLDKEKSIVVCDDHATGIGTWIDLRDIDKKAVG